MSFRRCVDESIPTLDLHGHRVDTALRAVTDFLELHRCKANNAAGRRAKLEATETCASIPSSPPQSFVLIITGTGNHSGLNGNGGPVLIHVIEDLLKRRQMTYSRGKRSCSGNTVSSAFVKNNRIGPGTFLVDPNSGKNFTFNPRYDPAAKQSTKVIVKSHSDLPYDTKDNSNNSLKRKKYAPSYFRSTSSPLKMAATPSLLDTKVDADFFKEWEKAKAISFQQLREEEELRKKETLNLDEALRLSSLHQKIDSIQVDQEAKMIQEALGLSVIDGEMEDELSQLNLALKLSQFHEEEINQREEELLKLALEASSSDQFSFSNEKYSDKKHAYLSDKDITMSLDTSTREISVVHHDHKLFSHELPKDIQKLSHNQSCANDCLSSTYDFRTDDGLSELQLALKLSQLHEEEINRREEELVKLALEASSSDQLCFSYDKSEDNDHALSSDRCTKISPDTPLILKDARKLGNDLTNVTDHSSSSLSSTAVSISEHDNVYETSDCELTLFKMFAENV